MRSLTLLATAALIPAIWAVAPTLVSVENGPYMATWATRYTTDPQLTYTSGTGTFVGPANSSGTFYQGPWGMEMGALLTTGALDSASDAATAGDQSTDNLAAGSSACGDSFDAAALTIPLVLEEGYSGISTTMVYASR